MLQKVVFSFVTSDGKENGKLCKSLVAIYIQEA